MLDQGTLHEEPVCLLPPTSHRATPDGSVVSLVAVVHDVPLRRLSGHAEIDPMTGAGRSVGAPLSAFASMI